MKSKIQITIPEPCQEGWQSMTPVEKGRFCASCQKTVLDFTHLSDNEIINLVSKKDNLCGRIKASQLNRNLIETKKTSNYFGYFATSVLAFLGLGTETIVAQEKPITEQTDLKYISKPTKSVDKITVTGVVTDSLGTPMSGTSVVIKDTFEGTQTDEKGAYSIKVNLGDTLEFAYLGYETTSIIVSSNIINVQLVSEKIEIIMIGGITKRRSFLGRTFLKIGNWFR